MSGARPLLLGAVGRGLIAWYDAQDSSSIHLSGSDLTQWDDRSGNGHYCTNNPVTKAQYGATSWNGAKPAISFSNSWIATPSWGSNIPPNGAEQPFTYISVIDIAAEASGSATVCSLWNDASTGGRVTLDIVSGRARLFREDNSLTSSSYLDPGTGTALTAKHFFAARYSSTTATIDVDGSSFGGSMTSLGTISAPNRFIIGAPTLFASGTAIKIAEVQVIGRAIDNTELAAIRTQLKAKWGGLP